MNILFPTLTYTFASFCVWLTVRIINRRERRANWTLAVMIGLPLLYVASFGPACWISSRFSRFKAPCVSFVYRPVLGLTPMSQRGLIQRYACFLADESWCWFLERSVSADELITDELAWGVNWRGSGAFPRLEEPCRRWLY